MSGAGRKTLGPRLWAEEVPAGANTPIYISSYGQSFQEGPGPMLSIATLLQSSIARSCDSGSTLRRSPWKVTPWSPLSLSFLIAT